VGKRSGDERLVTDESVSHKTFARFTFLNASLEVAVTLKSTDIPVHTLKGVASITLPVKVF